ncbi:MAG: hypothetical protein K2J74_00690, partial [Muribaculaceae bacterium]|nr:hypothetical protein [Muribaculaceae bacterium]
MQTTTTYLRLIALTAALCFLGIATVHATDFHPDSVQLRMARQLYEYPQEKMHVTTDQSRYVAGDTVWLRA